MLRKSYKEKISNFNILNKLEAKNRNSKNELQLKKVTEQVF